MESYPGFINNVSTSVITKARLKLEPSSGLHQSATSSCTPQPIGAPAALAHSGLKGGPRQKKESVERRAAECGGAPKQPNISDISGFRVYLDTFISIYAQLESLGSLCTRDRVSCKANKLALVCF